MPVTEQQLDTWAKPVRLRKDIETRDYVKNLFRGYQFQSSNFEIYLQGSVANYTNIRADGDIDIVFQYNGTFGYSRNYGDYNSPSSYSLNHLRSRIRSILNDHNIRCQDKDKCIKLNLKERWQDVDLIPCFQYRYHLSRYNYCEGIKIRTLNGKEIINYPKIHRMNGEKKNDGAPNHKNMVRVFKNIKKRLVEERWCEEELAPSYFIECLLYNVTDRAFYGNNSQSFVSCLTYLAKQRQNWGDFKCQNEIECLFGNGSTQWNESDCQKFLTKIVNYIR